MEDKQTIYRVWIESAEARTRRDEEWTPEELLNCAYDNLEVHAPRTLKEFGNEKEAMDFYEHLEAEPAFKRSVSNGFVLCYEVVGISKIDTLDGEDVDFKTLRYKTTV